MKNMFLLLLVTLFSAQTWAAVDAATVPEIKRTPQNLYLTAQEAYDMVQKAPADVLFVDIRTQAEVEFLGMPTLADANIPFVVQNTAGWDEKKNVFAKAPNPGFESAIAALLQAKGLSKTSPIILMCRSGDRSAKASALLHKSGYVNVHSMVDGFEGDAIASGAQKGLRMLNGWKNAGLPWTYALDKSKMYLGQ